MADKEVRVKIIGDTSDLTKKLSNLKKELKDIANGVGNGNNNIFDKPSKDADNFKDSIKDVDKAVDNLNDSLKQTNKNNNFDNLNKSTSKLSTNMTKLKDKIKDAFSNLGDGKLGGKLKDTFKSIEEPLKKLKDSFSKLKGGNFSGAFDSLKVACSSTVGKLTAVVAGITAVYVALRKLADAGKQRFFSGLEDMKNTFQPLVNLAKSLGQELKTAFENITGTQLDLSSAIEQAVEFESTMARVGAIAGASGDDLTKLTNTAREWGAKTRYSANEVAEAMSYMGMSGWSATEITQGLEGVLNLATVGCIDLAQASDFVTKHHWSPTQKCVA